MDVSAYLSRIGLDEMPPSTLEGLRVLQDHHMRHIPFENLDVLIGRKLKLSPKALFEKVVSRRRGGYCFELNTLYAKLLYIAGFEPVPMLARVWLRDPVDVPPRTHLVHRVEIDGQIWVTDVGFGGRAARVPLNMGDASPIEDGDGPVRIISDPEFGYRVQRFQGEKWSNQYSVEFTPAHWFDILCGNHWTENSPESHFRHGIGVGLFTPCGRTSFYGGVLTHRGKVTKTQNINGVSATLDVLRREFGLDLNFTQNEVMRLSQFT